MTTIPTKKLKNGFEMPVYGLGTWQMGGRKERDLNNDDEADIRAIRSAIESGVKHIDTAESYADGYSEILIGQAIKEYDRNSLFIVSKVRKEKLSHDQLIQSCEQSLQRLGTDYLDLYLMHSYSSDISLRESVQAMDKLIEQGKIRNFGVSNFTKEHLAEAQSYTENIIVCNQVYYNLKCREPETSGLLEYCQQNDVMLVAYRPVEKGSMLTDIPAILEEMSKKYDNTAAQICLNWLISQDHVVTISKTRSPDHLQENLGAIGWQMNPEDIEKLRDEYPNQISVPEDLPLK